MKKSERSFDGRGGECDILFFPRPDSTTQTAEHGLSPINATYRTRAVEELRQIISSFFSTTQHGNVALINELPYKVANLQFITLEGTLVSMSDVPQLLNA